MDNQIPARNKSGRSFLIIGIVAVILLLAAYIVTQSKSSSAAVTDSNGQVQLSPPRAQENINRQFSFPLTDDKGNQVGQFTYTVDTAQLQDDIIVKGQKASAVKGRTFLIINLKIKNDLNSKININTRDYIRLTINNSSDMLAPDIHNDPVEVQPISTELTRVGFPINIGDKNLALHIGEIKGSKTTIPLNFSK